MTRGKIPTKIKEPIKIRTRGLKNGCLSIYLDTVSDGRRFYEFLKLYLIPPIDPVSRQRNAETMRAAQAIKARRMSELINAKAGLNRATDDNGLSLLSFIQAIITMRKKNGNRTKGIKTLLYHLKKAKINPLMKDINKSTCSDFLYYLKQLTGLKQGTKHQYFALFCTVLNEAVRGELIDANPANKLSRAEKIGRDESTREYLTETEVKRLITTPCKHDLLKRGFLFMCFCGLRVGDLSRLTWGDIKETDNGKQIEITQQKTRRKVIIPLSKEALKWLPNSNNTAPTNKVFTDFTAPLNLKRLKDWVKLSGITKNITFHVARHTFATMLITFGADLYTVSKLLGHTNIATTQIYAKIVDRKKVDAINLFNKHF